MSEFKTDNLSLCPFLEMSGLTYLRAEPALGKNDRPVVSFIFKDPKGIGKDLELEFMRSEFKNYRDLMFFFRNEIEKMKRRLEKIRIDERRSSNDKYYSGE